MSFSANFSSPSKHVGRRLRSDSAHSARGAAVAKADSNSGVSFFDEGSADEALGSSGGTSICCLLA